MVSKKATPRDRVLLFIAAVCGVLLTLVILFFALPTGFAPLGLLLIAGVWFGIYRLNGSFHVEFEYIMTGSEMDIDRILDKRVRKRLLTVDAKNIERLCPYEEAYLKDLSGDFRRVDASSAREESERYFLVAPDKEGKKLFLIFEPDERILERFSRYCPRNVTIR